MLIGLTGVARAGKDSVGRILVEKRGFQRVSFADKLRAVALGADPWVRLDYDQVIPSGPRFFPLSGVVAHLGWEGAKAHKDVREFLQRLGTEGVRQNLGMDVWVGAALEGLDPAGDYVFTDVRFPNEAQAIIAGGGQVWHVARPGFEPVNAHVSDAGLPDDLVHLTVPNRAGLDYLELVVLRAADIVAAKMSGAMA